MGRAAGSVVALVLLLVGSGCATGAEEPAAEEVPAPAGLGAVVDQSRVERVGREVFVRLVDDAGLDLTVLRADLTSDRFATVSWTGESAPAGRPTSRSTCRSGGAAPGRTSR